MTSSAFLARLVDRAPYFGVTRLADITQLDRIGLPVWQAVRPAGLALSVHQGKGATAVDARIGALCEAIENDCAERTLPDGPCCPADALNRSRLSPDISDYARERGHLPFHGAPVQWCSAADLLTGQEHYLPHDLVSLDFTRAPGGGFERSSDGLGAGASLDDAIGTGIREAVERDAAGEWQRQPLLKKMSSTVNPASVPFDWFQRWRERLRVLGISLRLFATEAVEGLPFIMCVIASTEEFRPTLRMFGGWCVHGNPETALFKAFAEAVQSRLTQIAAARDDIMPADWVPDPTAPAWLAVPPVPAGFPQRTWGDIEPRSSTWRDVAERLVERGYAQVVMKRLDRGDIPVVKIFVPGLGSRTRTRRKPLWH